MYLAYLRYMKATLPKNRSIALKDTQLTFERMQMPACDWTKDMLKQMAYEVLEYAGKANCVWYRAYFTVLGLSWKKVSELAKRSKLLAEALELADELLEARYLSIPFHKVHLTRHCGFMLEKVIQGNWRAQATLNVQVQSGTIFEQLEATPIIEVIDAEHVMEPDSKGRPSSNGEKDVSVYKDMNPSPSRNIFFGQKGVFSPSSSEFVSSNNLENGTDEKDFFSSLEPILEPMTPFEKIYAEKAGFRAKMKMEQAKQVFKRAKAGKPERRKLKRIKSRKPVDKSVDG
jgi:hypothetical protein